MILFTVCTRTSFIVKILGFLPIFLSLMMSCQESSSPSVGPSPNGFRAHIIRIPGNEFDGSCQDLSLWREMVGVQDNSGVGYSGHAGWTTAAFSYKFSEPIYIGRPQQYQCNCNKKIYDDVQTCLNECKASLGCYTGICPPLNGQVCLKTDGFITEFKVETKTFGLEWKPKQRLSSKCLIEKSQWEARLEIHEGRHVQDALDIAKSSNNKWSKPKTYEACAATEEEAKRIIKAMIKAELDYEITLMDNDLHKRSVEFHNTTEGSLIIDPDCNNCK